MSYSDIEHFSTILSGCEALTSGNPKSPDGLYTFTVLKLHAADAGHIAGTEGFLDSVKKGAQTVKQWFLSLLAAIRNFINEFRGNKYLKEQEKVLEEKEKEAKKDREISDALDLKKADAFESSFKEPGRLADQVYSDIKTIGYLDRDKFELFNVSNMRIHSGYEAIRQLVRSSKDNSGDSVKEISHELQHLEKSITELTFQAQKTVNQWSDETDQTVQRSDIQAASYLLKNFTQVLKWYSDGLKSYYLKVN